MLNPHCIIHKLQNLLTQKLDLFHLPHTITTYKNFATKSFVKTRASGSGHQNSPVYELNKTWEIMLAYHGYVPCHCLSKIYSLHL